MPCVRFSWNVAIKMTAWEYEYGYNKMVLLMEYVMKLKFVPVRKTNQ